MKGLMEKITISWSIAEIKVTSSLFLNRFQTSLNLFCSQRKIEEEANLKAIWGGSWKNDLLQKLPEVSLVKRS